MTPALLSLILLGGADAARPPDPRLRTLAYDPAAVVAVHGCLGYQSTIAFGPDERVETVALGDAGLWQAVASKRADLLFLKPQRTRAHTNMVVVTDRRRYVFELSAQAELACTAGKGLYELRFTYPDEPRPAPLAETAPLPPATPEPLAPPEPPPGARNAAYSFTGAAANVPQRVFDDGRATHMRWAAGVAAPAIYALGADKAETLVNYTIKGDDLVIDGVAAGFVLRRGNAVAVLYNDAYQTPAPDAAAPRPRAVSTGPAGPRRPWLFARLFGRPAEEKTAP